MMVESLDAEEVYYVFHVVVYHRIIADGEVELVRLNFWKVEGGIGGVRE